MTGKLDRYVAKAVFGAYAAGLVFLILMTIVFDMLFNVGAYVEVAQERGIGIGSLLASLAQYYVLSVPLFFVRIGPFVTVIAGMFAVARLMGANEIVPMLFTGRSVTQVLRPLLLVGFGSAAAMAACWEYVIPHFTEARARVESRLTGGDVLTSIPPLRLREGSERCVVFIDEYDRLAQRMHGLSFVDEGTGARDSLVLRAEYADWNPELRVWDLTAGVQRAFDGQPQAVAVFDLPELTPDIIWRSSKEQKELEALSYSELRDLQSLRPGRRDFTLALQSHITFPLANLILLALALPFAVHFERGRKIERVLFAVLVCALYLVADLTCQNLSRTGYLHPIFAAWLTPICFGSLGVVFFGSIRS